VQKYFMTFSAILVIILGIYNFAPGLTMVGVDVSSLDFGGSGSEAVAGTIEEGESGEVQVIEVEVRGLDYYPNSFTVKQGVPVEFLVDGSGAVGCAQIFAIPDMGINQRLSRGVDTITFTPQKTGKMIFSCGMGMAGPGVIEVI
jgi:plastocyanin